MESVNRLLPKDSILEKYDAHAEPETVELQYFAGAENFVAGM
jgi:hypothetical protein